MPEKKGQQPIFIVRTCMYFSMQENEKRHDMRFLADGCLFEDFVRPLDPKDPDGDRGFYKQMYIRQPKVACHAVSYFLALKNTCTYAR